MSINENYSYMPDLSSNEKTSSPLITGNEELLSYYQPHISLVNTEVTGTEDLSQNTISFGPTQGTEVEEAKLHVYSSDTVNFRLYMCANTSLKSAFYQNNFCRFIDSLQPEHTVVIEMGSMINGWMHNFLLGSMIRSLQSTKGTVITLASGQCGFGESCLWLFGKKRIISPYGSLLFTGISEFKKVMSMYESYFDFMFDTAQDLNVLDKEQAEILRTTSRTVMITSSFSYMP